MKFPFLLRKNEKLLILNSANSIETYSHFLKMKIYAIGFNNNLVTSEILAICFLKMTLEHSSVANFQVSLAHFQWQLYLC